MQLWRWAYLEMKQLEPTTVREKRNVFTLKSNQNFLYNKDILHRKELCKNVIPKPYLSQKKTQQIFPIPALTVFLSPIRKKNKINKKGQVFLKKYWKCWIQRR